MPLLLLDKDGTLTKSKSGKEFVESPEDQEVLPGVTEALRRYLDQDYIPVIISNQAGVQQGYKTYPQAVEEMRYCMSLLPFISIALFCPDFDGENCMIVTPTYSSSWPDEIEGLKCTYRKPGGGMIHLASRLTFTHNNDLQKSLLVGDRNEDREAAAIAKINFQWVNEWREGKEIKC